MIKEDPIMEQMEESTNTRASMNMKKVKMKPIQVAFLLYTLVAAGAFGIEDMVPTSGPGLTLIMLTLFAIIYAHPISKTASELTALMPGEGGIYVWAKETLGEFWGFAMGWWGTICIYIGGAADVVLITDYASHFVPALTDPTISFITRLGIICLFMIVNLLGIQEAGWVNTVMSIFILAGFALVTIVGFANWQYNPIDPVIPDGSSIIEALGGSIMIVIWMYNGYDVIANMAGEVENPEAIHKGFRIVMPIIALSYILPTMAGLVSIGHWEDWGTEGLGYGDVLGQCLGYGWGVGFLVVAIIGQAAIFNAYTAEGSRGFFVLADDNLFPRALVKQNKRGIPVISILLLGACAVFFAQFDFETVVIMTVVNALMVYILLGICALKARKAFPVEERTGWYINSPLKAKVFAVAPMIIAFIGLLVNGTDYFLLGFCSIVSAVVVYLPIKWCYGGLYKQNPERFPINPKTRLAQGDLQRLGAFFIIFGLYAVFGSFFLQWYEGGWGPDYYLETYGSSVLSNFWLMLKISRIGGILGTLMGIVLLAVGKKSDPVTWRGTGDWGEWADDAHK